MSQTRSGAWSRLGLVLLVLVGGLLPAQPAAAAELHPRPASGYYLLGGAGFGHGHGMSQYGARAGAAEGASAATILSRYYPSTTSEVLADTPMRVELRRAGSSASVLGAMSGRRLESGGASLSLPPGRVRVRSAGVGSQLLRVELLGGDGVWRGWPGRTGWERWRPGRVRTFRAPVVIHPPSTQPLEVITPSGEVRAYRGALEVQPNPASSAVAETSTHPGALAGAGVRSVNIVAMESYLLGVVGREMPASWPAAALGAQAVAARSYAARERVDWRERGRSWDLCDTESCQVYGGVWVRATTTTQTVTQLEDPRVTAAVGATRGVIRSYGGKPIFAQFSASNGGWMAKGSQPYLVAGVDSWTSGDPHLEWEARLPVSHLEARYPQLGRLSALAVTQRDGQGRFGGRVLSVELRGVRDGTATSVVVSGSSLRSGWSWPSQSTGMRSTYWEVRAQ